MISEIHVTERNERDRYMDPSLDRSASMGPRRVVRSGLRVTRHPDTKKKSTTGSSRVDWAAEKPQPLSLRYYPKRVSKKPIGVVVVDAQNGGAVVAGPMRCCEAVDRAHELNEQLRPKPKGGNKKRHNKK